MSRTRNYATVLYPDSCDIQSVLDSLQSALVPAFLSPLHCYDTNADGTPKKPHYHLLIMFTSVKSKNQAIEFFDALGGVGCEVVNSSRAYARYLCHLDNPDKHQYSPDDVVSFCGADYLDIISLSTDKYGLIREMVQFCAINNIYYYSELLEYAMANNETWFRCLCDNGTYVMREYLKSFAYFSKQDN